MRHRWKIIRYKLEWLGLQILTRLIPRLPRRFVARLAKGIGTLAYRLDSRGRKVALANIEAAFGDRYTPEQREAIARDSFRDFARTMLDMLWSPALNPENYKRYMHIEGMEILENLRDRGEGAIVLVIHHGNFEWASQAGAFSGMPGVIVTDSFKNEQLSNIFKRCR